MLTTAMLLGLAWKSVVVAALTLGLLRLVRSRTAGERSMIAHAGLMALLALPAAILLLPQWAPLPASWSFEAAAPLAQPATTGDRRSIRHPPRCQSPSWTLFLTKGMGPDRRRSSFRGATLRPFSILSRSYCCLE